MIITKNEQHQRQQRLQFIIYVLFLFELFIDHIEAKCNAIQAELHVAYAALVDRTYVIPANLLAFNLILFKYSTGTSRKCLMINNEIDLEFKTNAYK